MIVWKAETGSGGQPISPPHMFVSEVFDVDRECGRQEMSAEPIKCEAYR